MCVCDLCHQRRPRAPDTSQNICVECLRRAREAAGILPPREPVAIDPDFAAFRDSCTR